MNTYLAASDVKLSFPLVDAQGNPVLPSAASYRVLDEDGVVLAGPTSILAASSPATIVIPAALNQTPAPPESNLVPQFGTLRAYRRVELTIGTIAGDLLLTQEYILERDSNSALVPGTNSFQTINKAELVALDIPNLNGWNAADRNARVAAMIQARLNLGQMSYRYRWSENWQNFIFPEFGIYSIIQFTQDQYLSLPVDFRQTMERAQIMEADDLLGTDPVLAKRQQGITSETIGSSTTMFGQVRPVRQLICPRAMHELSRYIVKRIRLSRA